MARRWKLTGGLLVLVAMLTASVDAQVGGAVPAAEAAKPQPAAPGPAVPEEDVDAVVQGNTAFALNLYAKLREQEGNLFLSPGSISTALAMTYAGARGGTAEQMAGVLHFTLPAGRLHPAFAALAERTQAAGQAGGNRLSIANALWGQKSEGFLPEFLNLARKYYGAGFREVDFSDSEAARRTINGWVEQQTEEKIKDLIPPPLPDRATVLILTNAIYFKGQWAAQFDEADTRERPFRLSKDDSVDVPMMNQTDRFGYAEDEAVQVLELPYQGDRLSMVVVLPKEGTDLAEVEQDLTPERLASLLASLRRTRVVVTLPRFTFTSAFDLSKVLQAMGMKDAFGGDADFSGMDGRRDLWIGAVLHKAFVDVSEEGTEAAAATAVIMVRSAARPGPQFVADHPFLFLIRDRETGSILFMGRCADPSK